MKKIIIAFLCMNVFAGIAAVAGPSEKTVANLKEIPTALPNLWDGTRIPQTSQRTS